ncbi:MAG: hypothetical protein A2Y03_10125 [Omnitrophica WOR_2 bacterium GWF2_38_59]|nr:MAG: hypothetical protein A2Y03_10125 [Omnitrophica WOR_2 bacterium GWF2_38_59]OGX46965.1 MAG: hypothetical protein A2243_08385 [Omnitrophica WOR_2 bacterium RIFOXYA2_FULL_38_17]OGX54198.1 MAG: hypothetical protein A2267_00620 [Omnitrophica WOR_2 bacterium RIFOXYA12_FULL_38_10]OGX55214.1 MAG: hypothetical protein A2447_04555 [Omnitrophica WOR_2 bacterium RIFOXYC2_FULL_38_12]OGX57657.1 MAG: hypothetical protein A2306_07560 [Omnitrophica WOR_2 bacterium RIFOXYB2_FULL_38_16]
MKETKSNGLRSKELSVQQNRFKEITRNRLNAGFYAADKEGNISLASNSLAALLHYSNKNEVLGLNMAERLYETKEDRVDFLKKILQEGHVEDYKVNMVCKDGSKIILSASSTLLLDENGEPLGVEGILEEVTEDKVKEKSKERKVPDMIPIEENAAKSFNSLIRDPLTDLYSYQYFMTAMLSEIRRVERIFHPTCLMMIDIDNFSKYDQINGREKSDNLLKKFAGLLKENMPMTDIICRQAQDQFLVLLTETKRDEALAVAKSCKDAIKIALKDENITCSIGISRFIIGMTGQEFFLQANLGLYMAKESGKSEACLYG